MFIHDIMTREVVTVAPGSTLEDACRIMHDRNIRHLPVLEGDRLVGVVTDRDVHSATSALCLAPAPPRGLVGEAMSRPPRTASPLDSIDEAARTMRSAKIGCLPVLDGDQLVGIVTGIDLLDALLRMTGVDHPSGRLEVRLSGSSAELTRLVAFLGEGGLALHSVLTYVERPEVVRTVLRVATVDTRLAARALREAGFEVLWPPEKPWSP